MTSPQTSLEELKRRLNQAQEVQVSSDGKLQPPDDPKTASQESGKTVLKPQRWF
ncbi:hypothetical protein HC928_01830 [bacterium]|nr:hypothetical protein [bacterium]